jgi:hypothetical protein
VLSGGTEKQEEKERKKRVVREKDIYICNMQDFMVT